MTIFDYLVLFILGSSIIIGVMRGLVKEVFSLLGWVVALVVANMFVETMAAWLPPVIPGVPIRLIVAFIVLFIAVRLLVGLLSMTVASVVKASGLSSVDRGLGALFGVLRALIIVIVVVMLCGLTAIPRQPFWREAVLSRAVESIVVSIEPLLPSEFARRVQFEFQF